MKRNRLLLTKTGNSKMRKVFLFLAAVAVCFCMTNEAIAQTVVSGTTGSCRWAITGTSGDYTLTITGNGAMENYSSSPWYSYRTGIKMLDIQQGVMSIGNNAFRDCIDLTSVTIPNSVTSIGDYAFYRCTGLTSITIPNSVTDIGYYAFEGCTGLTAIDVHENNTAYTSENGVLFNKAKTTLIQYPIGKTDANYTILNSVTAIGDCAFYDCTGLTSVTIPHSVKAIGNEAFEGCTGLISVTIPHSVTTIGEMAFYDCTGLTAIDVHENNTAYTSENGVLFNKAKTTLIQYPIGKTDANYTIPHSVTAIGERAFVYCIGLTSVTIPNSVTNIGVYAFAGCTGLTSVINLNPTPQAMGSSGVFYNVAISNITLYVPAESVETYQSAAVWRDFKTITAYTPSTINTPSTANAICVYPNPATESFRIAGLTATTPVTITDINGRTVLQQTVAGDESISVGHLPQGIYLVRVNGQTVKTIKN